MATEEEKQELIEVLKFNPYTARVELGPYGGEAYCGRVSRRIYEHFKEHRVDLEDYAFSWDDNRWYYIPESLRPFDPGSPYECDNLAHASGASLVDVNTLTVYDDDHNEIFSVAMDLESLAAAGVRLECIESFSVDVVPPGTVMIWGAQGEKGLPYGGVVELTRPFDPTKLLITYSDLQLGPWEDRWCITDSVIYDGEYVANDDYSTASKWSTVRWIIAGGEEPYDPEPTEE